MSERLIALARRIQARPWNASGSDKTWVLEALSDEQLLRLTGFLFFLPTLLFVIVFLIGPIGVAVAISFTKFRVISAPEFVGLANYLAIMKMGAFWDSLFLTARYIFFRLAIILVLAYFMAQVVHMRLPGSGVFQSIFFLPYVFPLAVTSVVWKIFFRPRGLIESFTDLLGIDPVAWLASPDFALSAVLIVTVWSGVGYYAIILLAGLQTIPKEVNEAALVDGLSGPQRFYYVTLPLLKPTLFYLLVIGIVNTIQGFDPFLVMTDGGPGRSTQVIGLLIFKQGVVNLRMGIASAMSVIVLLFIFLLTILQQRLLRSRI